MMNEKIKNYVLDQIKQSKINKYPFFNLYIENIFPENFYERLKSRMLDYKYNSVLQDRNWVDNNDKILEETKGKGIYLGEFGHRSLRNFMDDDRSMFDDASKVQSIDHRYAWKYMEFENGIDEYITEDQPFFMLNNAVIYDKLKKMSRNEVFLSNILLCQFIRKSLHLIK